LEKFIPFKFIQHAHTHAYSHRGQKQFQETSRVPAFNWRAPDLEIYPILKNLLGLLYTMAQWYNCNSTMPC